MTLALVSIPGTPVAPSSSLLVSQASQRDHTWGSDQISREVEGVMFQLCFEGSVNAPHNERTQCRAGRKGHAKVTTPVESHNRKRHRNDQLT